MDAAASSAAIGTPTRRRSSAIPSMSCAASGCSTNSMSKRAIASSRSVAVSRSQAPLTSSRSAISGPIAARIARTRSTSTSVSRSAPALTLSVDEARLDRLQRGLRGRRRGPSDGSVALTPTPPSSSCSARDRSVEVEPGALSIAAASARPGAPCCSRSAERGQAIRGALDRLADQRRRGSSRPPRRSAGSSTASPSPTRPSSSTSRRIHASRSTHIPVAVGNGRRKGIRTRSATRDRTVVMRSRRRSRARPRTAEP